MSHRFSRPRFPTATLRGAALLIASLLVLLPGAGPAEARLVPGPTQAAPTSAAPTSAARISSALPTRAEGAEGSAPGVWPLRPEPAVVHGFAPPPVAWAAGHRGVDLAARPGQQVRAARAGTVTFAGRIAGRGVVVVSHGETRTTYEPVAASVSRGATVAAGTVLGRLELLGSHCLPSACLHWGLLRDETYLNPLTLVGRGPVRLLPWGGLADPPGPLVAPGFLGAPGPPLTRAVGPTWP